MKMGVIPGARPEVLKMSPVVRACQRQGADYFVIHTGQGRSRDVDWFMVHTGQDCSCDMGQVFSGGLRLPDVGYSLDVGSGSEGHWSCQAIVPLAAGCYVDDVIERFRTSCCIR